MAGIRRKTGKTLRIAGRHSCATRRITVMLGVYAHVMPGDQKRAADRFAALVGEA